MKHVSELGVAAISEAQSGLGLAQKTSPRRFPKWWDMVQWLS